MGNRPRGALHVGTSSRSVSDALASCGDIWRHATSTFVELRIPSGAEREAWPLRPEWKAVQGLAFTTFPFSGVVPFVELQCDRIRLLRALYGYLTSLGAAEGRRSLGAVLDALPSRLSLVARGRSFEAEVDRKRRLLPLAVRCGDVDSRAVSAGPRKEAPWAHDPSQRDTGTDA